MSGINASTGSHVELTEALAISLARVLVQRPDIFHHLSTVEGLDVTVLEQPERFLPRVFWATAVLDIGRQGALPALIESVVREFPNGDFEKYRTLSTVNDALGPDTNWKAFDDPLDARFVGPGYRFPIFDREGLRTKLRLLRDGGFRTMNIVGEPQSGKTFSLQLLQLALKRRGDEAILVDIEDWGTAPFDDIDLVSDLASQLGVEVDSGVVDEVPDPHTRARTLFHAFRDAVTAPTSHRWIIIDGLDRPNVGPRASAFVERMLKSVDQNHVPSDTNVLLTGFGGVMPRGGQSDEIGDITKLDLDRWVRVVCEGLQPEIDNIRREALLDEAMQVLQDAQGDLGALGDHVFVRIDQHFSGAPA